jgi:hypothetical protein
VVTVADRHMPAVGAVGVGVVGVGGAGAHQVAPWLSGSTGGGSTMAACRVRWHDAGRHLRCVPRGHR